ncbi:MAG: DMT family transporter, partial [Desulfobacula sp.]|nr:DMT family transporter [Desulfobacula sp.]
LIVISKGNLLNILEMGLDKGELLILGCVASWVAYSLLGKKAMASLSPIASVCYSSVAGTIMLFFPAFSKGVFTDMKSYNFVEWGSLFYLGFFGTVLGFLWYYEGIKKIGPMKAGIFINLVPICVIFLSFFILNESITPALIIGALFVIAGIYLTNSTKILKKES